MKKVTSIVLALTMLLLFALISSCSETVLPTENIIRSENSNISMRTPLYRVSSEPLEYVLFADEDMDVGKVTISNDLTNLYVTYELNGGSEWCITETHVEVAIYDEGGNPVWPGKSTNNSGNPRPGQFTKSMDHDCVYTYTETILIPDVDPEYLAVAAHAKIKKEVVVPDCWETVWQIGDVEGQILKEPENIFWLTNYADEFNWEGANELTFGSLSLPQPVFPDPFVVGFNTDPEFPWNSHAGAWDYATDFDVQWDGSLPFGGKLTLSWDPGRENLSNPEHKKVFLPELANLEIGNFYYTTLPQGIDPAFWYTGERLVLVEDVAMIPPLTDGTHTINLQHLAGQGALWDWILLEQPCTETFYESAWAVGEPATRFVEKGNWATWVDYDLTCEPNWVLTGEWVFTYDFGGTPYSHDYNFDTGTGGYPAGVSYTHPEDILSEYPAVSCGDIVEFTFQYTQDAVGQKGLLLWATGTIAGDGTITGVLTRSDPYPNYPVDWTAVGGTIEKQCVPCQEN